ncbi:hypothetical protein [Nonomuraea recticatena]|uniref:hypothetical protein n=1 Tax=Nonomuraea recticatena TaxID=46178 RepID=UPI0031F83FC8
MSHSPEETSTPPRLPPSTGAALPHATTDHHVPLLLTLAATISPGQGVTTATDRTVFGDFTRSPQAA